jgi:hypothetical protein
MNALEAIKTLIQVKRNFLDAMLIRHAENKDVYHVIKARLDSLNDVLNMIDDFESLEVNLDQIQIQVPEIPSTFPTTPA